MLFCEPGAVVVVPVVTVVVLPPAVIVVETLLTLLPATVCEELACVPPALAVVVTVVPPAPCCTPTVTCGAFTCVVLPEMLEAPVVAPAVEPVLTAPAMLVATEVAAAGLLDWPVAASTEEVAVVAIVLIAAVAPELVEAWFAI